MGGIVLAAVGAAAARRGKLPSSRETRITGVAPPRPREGWTNLVANDSMPARDSGLMVALRAVSEGWTGLGADDNIKPGTAVRWSAPAKVGGAFGANDNDTGI